MAAKPDIERTQAESYQGSNCYGRNSINLQSGRSTNFLIVQDEAYLAQARSSEAATQSDWMKARLALALSLGNLVDEKHVVLDDAIRADSPGGAETGRTTRIPKRPDLHLPAKLDPIYLGRRFAGLCHYLHCATIGGSFGEMMPEYQPKGMPPLARRLQTTSSLSSYIPGRRFCAG